MSGQVTALIRPAVAWLTRFNVISWLLRHYFIGSALVAVLAGEAWAVQVTGEGLTKAGMVRFTLLSLAACYALTRAWWVYCRRRALAAHSTPAPPVRRMLAERKDFRSRSTYAQKQTAAFFGENKVKDYGGTVLRLHRPKPNEDLDLKVLVYPGPAGVKGGVQRLRTLSADLAETCGCTGGVHVKQIGIGIAELTYMWSDLLDRELPVAKMPMGRYNYAGYGITHGAASVGLKLGLSTLVIGQTGSGKSKTARAFVTDLKRKQVNTCVYAMDPKRQELARIEKLAEQEKQAGSLTFKGYGRSLDECAEVVAELDRVMKQRQDDLAEAGIDEWEEKHAEKFPLVIGLIDEVFELMTKWKPNPRTKINPAEVLFGILSQGRAAGVQIVMLSQVAHKEILGMGRSLVKQRIVHSMESAMETGMAFGDPNAEDKGARCSQITEPGMGYAWIEGTDGTRGYVPFRAGLVSNADWDIVLNTDGLPEGMEEGKSIVSQPYLNYRFYTSDRQPLRTGITNNFERRYGEYARSYEKERQQIEAGYLDPAKALHQWFPYHDPAQTIVTEADSKDQAKHRESEFIAQGVWRGNHQENMRSHLRNVPPPQPEPKPSRWHRTQKPAPERPEFVRADPLPVVETPANVRPIRRTRPDTTVTTTRRRRAS